MCRPHMLVMLWLTVFCVSCSWTNWVKMLRLNIHFLIVWSCPLFWDSEQKSEIFHPLHETLPPLILRQTHFWVVIVIFDTVIFVQQFYICFGKKSDSVCFILLLLFFFFSDEETLLNPWNNCNLSQCDALKTVKDFRFDKYVTPHIAWT